MIRLALAAVLIAAPACAQKPDADPDPRDRRADSLVTRPAQKPADDAPMDSAGDIVAPPRNTTISDTFYVDVGDRPVGIARHLVYNADRRADTFWAINLHDDEGTSVEAALDVARRTGGTVIELVHTGDRNLSFANEIRAYPVDGGPHQTRRYAYVVDPNRMFTPAGLRRSLEALSPGTAQGGDVLIQPLVDKLLFDSGLEDAEVVITLHNNTPDNYSAASYLPGERYASDAAAVTVHPGSDPDDFYFVTGRDLYDALVARGFNAVLQDNDQATDDGSLSVWAARNDRPYVNVEAQRGHLAEQITMMEALVEVMQGE